MIPREKVSQTFGRCPSRNREREREKVEKVVEKHGEGRKNVILATIRPTGHRGPETAAAATIR